MCCCKAFFTRLRSCTPSVAMRALLVFVVLNIDYVLSGRQAEDTCVEQAASKVKRERLVVQASSAAECQELTNSAIWRAFSQSYGPQKYDPRPYANDGSFSESCSSLQDGLMGRFFKWQTKSSRFRFVPKFVLYGSAGEDPERDWKPSGEVDFSRVGRKGFRAVTITEAYSEDKKTLKALVLTAAYAYANGSNTFPATSGYVGVFKTKGCNSVACWMDSFVTIKYTTSCKKKQGELHEIVAESGGLEKYMTEMETCSVFPSEEVIVFRKSDTCRLVLDSVYETVCNKPAAS
eukprot:TRINITY_DN13765_c0_g2_i1.p1 TRINITY_DN13765_c0_g2~~TRINITY_DN13765_c0_g2_i1.p1  ORF type:complete len:291 (+),score=39.47 TRINITY_DN13765_c0_g2_i1:2-874(+)